FTLCLDDAADYDLFEGAEDVTAYIGGCSPDAAYTTVGAGGDLNKGTCWNNSGPRYNRWFKFTAPASGMINITVDIGGSKGTQQRTQLALWESDGTTQVDCDIYNFNSEDVNLNTTGLTPGSTYYISVDTYNSGYYGSFTLCLADAPDYDLFEGAKDVTAYIGGCSPNAAYTTVGAGGDLNKGTCWNNSGPRYNRWFKFTAPASGMINITVDIGGSKGTQQRTQLALWENDGTTQIACDIYNFNNEDVEVGATSLIPGSVYYFSVDTYNSGYYGSFSLCLEDKPSYDYFEGAIELTDLNNWCSADGEYSTVGGTADKNKGSCWNNSGPRYNRWFKFTAVTNNVTISVEVGGSDGTQQRTQLALWESDGTTQIQCDKYISNSDDVALSDATLVVGNEYYISVDTYNSGYYGSFKLCIDNIDTEYYSISDGDWDDVNNWSIVSHVGAAAASYPIDGDVAYIQGHQITANVAQNCAEINLNIADDNSKLIIDGVAFNVAGQVNMTNSGNDFDGEIKLQNAGTLYINDALTMTRDGGANPFKIEIENGSTVTVNKDLTINSSSGTINNNEINLNGNAILTIRKDLELNHTGGIKSQITANSTSRILVEKDLSFTATTDDRVEIELNNSAQMKVKGSFNLGSPAYGIMDFNNTSTLEFNGTNIQSLPSFDGSGTGDFFDVNRIIINNTFGAAPQLSLTDDITIGTSLTLTKGVIDGNSYSITIPSGASISSGNASSYIDGALKIVGNSNANFPIGDGEVWAPLELKNLTGDAATEFTAQYLFEDFGDNSVTGILNNASILEYWNIDNTGTASNADVTLHWKSAARSEISDYADLVIAHYDGSDWENLGQSSIVSSSSGSITVSGVSSFSPFTFGSLSDDKNFLPITLGEFNLQAIKNQVLISWTTESEINNNFFTIEKSSNGSPFYPIGNVEGSGNSNRELNYHFYDQNPNVGVSYYRLKQTDFNGHYEYFEPKAIHFSFISSVPLQVYPNPTNNVVNIIMNPVDENNFIELKNTSGKTLFETQILQSNTEIQMPSEKGIYILYIHQGDDLIVKKIIKL
ncbi:MAG: T9SS type A sorting domain-containing protein, partial [Flavobacteriales bacterium]|nr:T9SS type A sorting domain-containing protein [Flavobacteriales bacterium]